MFKRIVRIFVAPALAVAVGLAIAGMTGCSGDGTASADGKQPILASAAADSGKASASASSSDKSGNQLWAETCARCHNMRDPSSYSDVNWSIAVHHMRVRADLNAQDSRKILEFLKSAN
jgi:cytochrome c553